MPGDGRGSGIQRLVKTLNFDPVAVGVTQKTMGDVVDVIVSRWAFNLRAGGDSPRVPAVHVIRHQRHDQASVCSGISGRWQRPMKAFGAAR